MLNIFVFISGFFTLSRFFAPGHAISFWGSWEALAHMWMGALLALTIVWWHSSRDDQRVILIACILVPSMIELALFLSR